MKRLLCLFLSLIFLCSAVACDKGDSDKKDNKSESESGKQKATYTFVSADKRSEWKERIEDQLLWNNFYEDLEYGLFGMALMDLNLDGTPELIAAYTGGSMGNVCLEAYDIIYGDRVCLLGDTPHYQDWDDVYFCTYISDEGEYITVNQGSLRNGTESSMMTSVLNNECALDAIFEEITHVDETKRYFAYRKEVDKKEFDRQKKQFEKKYKEITETQIKIIYWESIDTKDKSGAISQMADALVNSEQQFIEFDTDKEGQEFADYKEAYYAFVKDHTDSYRLFSLVYVDGDDIPELYMSAKYESAGDMICTYKNGEVVYQSLYRIGGVRYVPRSGNIINQNGHMGACHTDVYKLDENGFTKTFSALSYERAKDIGNGEYEFSYECYVEDVPVTKEEHDEAVDAAFDPSFSVRFDQNAVTYHEILLQLKPLASVG